VVNHATAVSPFVHRLRHLQQVIHERRLSGAILVYSRDIFYYAGTAQPAYLVVLPKDFILFVGRGFELARQECGLDAAHVVREGSASAICKRMFPGDGWGEKVGTELDMVSAARARRLSQLLGQRELVDISADILTQRMVKEPAEVESSRAACAAVDAGHHAIVSQLRPGMSELELAAAVENAQRLAGHEGEYFMRLADFTMSRGPVASGPNLRRTTGAVYTITGAGLSSAIPAGPSRRVIQRGELVLVDIPACVEGYHADQSRTYAVEEAPAKAEELFHQLREIADEVIRGLRPGMLSGETYSLAEACAAERGLEDVFLAFESQPRAHFIGHGVGLELNEPPLLVRNGDVPLQAGMVLAIEMHLMEPNGLTMKLEDTVHLTPQGAEVLTRSPRELTVVKT
jgi:Xaa-Pro aminopeptidase